MRFSKILIPTFKEAPKDVVLKSHEYLIRGGFIQQIGSGIYNFLPLGKRVLDNIKAIIKEEMDNTGANEVSLGFVTSATLWQKSGRLERYGKELLRFKDRKDNTYLLGPTHEEAVTELVKSNIKSYKQLPLHLYQINVKFRDEMRPRFGLIRAREFIMKDGYSFHANYEDLRREFNVMEQTYQRIFQRLGLDCRSVVADSGAIGGEGSKEFMVLAQSGEDTICVCDSCQYSANLEAATRLKAQADTQPPEANFAKFHTPNIKTIEALAEFFKISAFWTIKAVIKKALFNDGKSALVYFFIRGSDTLNLTKALNAIKEANELIDADEKDIQEVGLTPGFIGPFALRNITNSPYIYFDRELENASHLICGANEEDYHFVGVDLSTFEGLEFRDLIEVQTGNLCPMCGEEKGGRLSFTKGIEVGHIFQLGTKYSQAMDATFLDENGKAQHFIMGCYGIGVSRLLSAIIEQHHDEFGMIWTKTTAPFCAEIIISNIKDSTQMEAGLNIYNALEHLGISCLLDDRTERYGAKIADFELVGIPFGIVIGKELQNGEIELIERKTLQREALKIDNFEALIQTLAEKIQCH